MVRWSRDVSDTRISQAHPLFYESVGTDTRYFTTQYQRIFSAPPAEHHAFRGQPDGPRQRPAVDDGDPACALFQRGSALGGGQHPRQRRPPGSIATIPVDYKQDLFQLTEHADLDDRQPHRQGRLRLAEVPLRWVLVLALRRRVPLPQPDGVSDAQPRRRRAGRSLHRQPAGHRHLPADAPALRRVLRPGRLARDRFAERQLRSPLRVRHRSERAERPDRRAARASTTSRRAPDGITPGTPMFNNPSKKSFAPRLGVAWNPLGNKKQTVKGGYGIFYQPLTTSFYRGTTFRIYPYFAGVDIRQPTVFGPGNIAVLAAGVNPAHGAEALRVHRLRHRAAVHAAVARERSNATSDTTSSPRSATSVRAATTCRSMAIRTRRRPSTAPMA